MLKKQVFEDDWSCFGILLCHQASVMLGAVSQWARLLSVLKLTFLKCLIYGLKSTSWLPLVLPVRALVTDCGGRKWLCLRVERSGTGPVVGAQRCRVDAVTFSEIFSSRYSSWLSFRTQAFCYFSGTAEKINSCCYSLHIQTSDHPVYGKGDI